MYRVDAARTEQYYVHDLGALKAADTHNPSGTRYYFNPIQFAEVLPHPAGADPKSRFDHIEFGSSAIAHAQTVVQNGDVTLFPSDKAVNVTPGTHLVLTFPSTPSIGKTGQVRLYNTNGHRLVDTLDLSI